MNKKWTILGVAVVAACVFFLWRAHRSTKPAEVVKVVAPFYGQIQNIVSATGTVQPQNRLQIKPPIPGRIEQILVHEGEMVKKGQILALMSSTDRAALLDAARLQDPKHLKEWEDVYKPTPLIAPMNGEVIVKSADDGQTVTTSDDVVVLSDRLIVQAQVDETDIGKVKVGQDAMITLDAYPDIKVKGKVDHIYYESEIVNNVTIYQVDILPDRVPAVFRSGMSANVDIVQESKKHVLLIPLDAVKERNGKAFVLVENGNGKPVPRDVTLGISNDTDVEVLKGLTTSDKVLIKTKRYVPPGQGSSGGSPFMPKRRH